MKIFLISIFVCIGLKTYSQKSWINPVGTYDMDHTTKKEDGEVYGYGGSIEVKKLNGHLIIVNFFVCKGAPSYNMGCFVDTMEYRKNTAVYTNTFDTSCRITFVFTKKGIQVKEETENFNFGCGFGHAVIADGFYQKTSCCEPEVINECYGERIENTTAFQLLTYVGRFNTCLFFELMDKSLKKQS